MTTDDISARARDLALDIRRHKLLGTPLSIDDVADSLDTLADAPDDIECEGCETHADDIDSVSQALSEVVERDAPTKMDILRALMRVYHLLGYSKQDLSSRASALFYAIRAAK